MNEGAFGEVDSRAGIPGTLTLDFARSWVRPRVSDKRFRHIRAVAKVGRDLAELAGCDAFLVELAAWLHDACKEIKDRELIESGERLGLVLHPIERMNGHLIHGPVAALTVQAELGLTNDQVLEAISQHTLGGARLSLISKVVFLADCLEEGRPSDYTAPIWQALNMDGELDLDLALVVACDLNLRSLIDSGKPIHPRTVEMRNYYLDVVRQRG